MKSKDEIIADVLGCRDPDAVYGLHIEKLVQLFKRLPRERDGLVTDEDHDMKAVHDDVVAFVERVQAEWREK